jgi:hypothetical protein
MSDINKGELSVMRKNIFYALSVIFMVLSLTGCTVLGFWAGYRVDKTHSSIDPPSLGRVARIKSGTSVLLELRDYMTVEGKFQGVTPVDPTEYFRRYGEFLVRQKLTTRFPAMGDTITINDRWGSVTMVNKSYYLFSGFDLNTVMFRVLADSIMSSESLDNLDFIAYGQRKKIYPSTLKSYMDVGIIPLWSEVQIESTNGRLNIPGENIQKIELPKTVVGRVALSLIGLAVDIVVIREIRRWIGYSLIPVPLDMH